MALVLQHGAIDLCLKEGDVLQIHSGVLCCTVFDHFAIFIWRTWRDLQQHS